jgi:hypothetical protein
VAAATQRGPPTASPILQLFRAARQALARLAGDDQQHGAGQKKRSGETGRGLIMTLVRPIRRAFRLAKKIVIREPLDAPDPCGPFDPAPSIGEPGLAVHFEAEPPAINGPSANL